MQYYARITVPAMTYEGDAIEQRVSLSKGTLRKVKVCFPPGPAGLTHVRVWYRGWQIIPWLAGGWLAWDDAIFEFDVSYELDAEPYEVLIEAYNEDDVYDHTVEFWFDVKEPTETVALMPSSVFEE